MRNQIHRHKQAIAQKTIANLTELTDSFPSSPDPKNIPKSVCYIQITDFAEAEPKEKSRHFRNTFFGKLGRRIAPKRDLVDSALEKQRAYTETGPQRKTERPGTKDPPAHNEYSQRSSFIIQQLNNSYKMNTVGQAARDSMTEHRKGPTSGTNHSQLVKDIQKLRECENGYLQLMKRKSMQSKCSEDFPQVPLLRHLSDGETQGQESRMSKQDILLELREKLKNKQSRKHIYHALKSKNQLWNKIRFKTHQNFHTKERIQPQPRVLKTDHESLRLHCHLKSTAKSVYSINSKSSNAKTKDNLNNLRIESKPCTISFNTYSIPHLYSPLKQFLSPQHSPVASPEASPSRNRPKRALYEEIVTTLKTTKRGKDCKEREGGSANNQFRMLTPWQNIQEDQM